MNCPPIKIKKNSSPAAGLAQTSPSLSWLSIYAPAASHPSVCPSHDLAQLPHHCAIRVLPHHPPFISNHFIVVTDALTWPQSPCRKEIISFLQHPETAAPSYPRNRGEGGHSSGIRGGRVAAEGGFCCGMLPRLVKVNWSLAAYLGISHLLICAACQPFLLLCKRRGYSPLNRGLWTLTLL